ncbi:FkbM family methyltransferase [Methylorubrum aminovorans]
MQIDNEYYHIEIIWENYHSTVSFGPASVNPLTGFYTGLGRHQWDVRNTHIDILPMKARSFDNTLNFVDVGARDGLEYHWSTVDNLLPVLFEPDAEEARRLKSIYSNRFPEIVVSPVGLADESGDKLLHLTKVLGCSSLRRPNETLLARYPIGDWFTPVGETSIPCRRYDEMSAEGSVPRPDVIKVDVQGFEYEVLVGFGELLYGVVGIELEAHFYPLYEGQKLIGDLVTYLDQYGLALRAIREQSYIGFAKECVEFNAFFTRRDSAGLDEIQDGHDKRNVCSKIWGL